jgi:hypothetical protein
MIFIVWERIKLWRSLKTRDIWLLLEIRLQTSPNQWASLFLYTFIFKLIYTFILRWRLYSRNESALKVNLLRCFSLFFLLSKRFCPHSADPGYRLFRLYDAHDDPSGLPLNGNNIMETRVGPSVISIFEFLLRAHHSQAESTLQALFHRLTLLSPGNHSLLFVKIFYISDMPTTIIYILTLWSEDSDLTENIIPPRFQIPPLPRWSSAQHSASSSSPSSANGCM